MESDRIQYRVNGAAEDEIYRHLKECNRLYFPHLDRRVDVREYSKKIYERAVRFEAWAGDALVGLVGAYFNDPGCGQGYITDVSVESAWTRKGIASRLIRMCIDYAESECYGAVALEVDAGNAGAIGLYKRHGFKEVAMKGECLVMKKCLSEMMGPPARGGLL